MNHKENAKFVGRQLLLVILAILILLAVFAIGLVIGYGTIGGGSKPWSILSIDKWQEIIGKLTGK
ncbi:DNA-directed RNA polymerase subunit beta [Streptococcus sp. DD13]|uniref:DNA-directed RNA polymerase subunit beta n=1 Tax=Streptococcus sp. DD13 TaxID=1777881 RepID=UPI000795F9E3|nr:DNA-directed RNA polymerase subunit beta [Streptococcus sp. DD13]KXT79202.1 Competence-associated EpuA protein [Streptococcus sp. DD13]